MAQSQPIRKVLQGTIAIVLGDALFLDAYADPKKTKNKVKTSILLKVAKKLGYMEIYDRARMDPDHFGDILSKLVCFITLVPISDPRQVMNRLANLQGETKKDQAMGIQSAYQLRPYDTTNTTRLLLEKNFIYKPDEV